MNQTDPLDEAIVVFYRKVFEHAMALGQEFPDEDPAIIFDACNTDDRNTLLAAINAEIAKAVREARIDENQRRLDQIEAFKNRTPVPGEVTAASFGSAGAGMVEAAIERSFKERIAELKGEPHEI